MFVFIIVITILLILITIWIHVRNRKNPSLSTIIVIGAGGHCREMLSIIQNFNFNKYTVLWLLAKDDEMSFKKLLSSNINVKMSDIALIRRSRHVGQSYTSSIFTTLLALYDSLFICYRFNPRLFICNGPGICIPPLIATKLITSSKIVYIESFCRTQSLSLSGLIAYYIADHVLVQWESLTKKYPRCKFIGLLV